jgi:hypothetical protein
MKRRKRKKERKKERKGMARSAPCQVSGASPSPYPSMVSSRALSFQFLKSSLKP